MNPPKSGKQLCEYVGGSRMYHLDTAESDIDERGIWMHTTHSHILGLNRFKEERFHSQVEDSVNRELLHFANLLTRGNTEALDVLFLPEKDFRYISNEIHSFRDNRYSLIDSDKLYKMLRGYSQDEYRLALGERKGKIGGKRAAQIAKYGFSPKNFTQLFRLLEVGIRFFRNDFFVLDARDFGDEFYSFLMKIKYRPETVSVEHLSAERIRKEAELDEAFANRSHTYTIQWELINDLLLHAYLPYLKSKYDELIFATC